MTEEKLVQRAIEWHEQHRVPPDVLYSTYRAALEHLELCVDRALGLHPEYRRTR